MKYLLLMCAGVFLESLVLTAVVSSKEDNLIAPPTTVDKVDLQKYVGLWYEIAKIPNRFQKMCVSGTTAQYTLRENGRIDVINTCIESNGKAKQAKGLARVVDSRTNAKLQVSFVSFFGIRPFWGDYWIIGLGKDYEFAIVGAPDRKYGWILSRSPVISAEMLNLSFVILRDKGYDPEDFVMTPQ